MKPQSNLEDFIVLARRGKLSAREQRLLHSAVESSLEARLLLEAGRAFDRARSVEPGDEQLVERLADFAVKKCAVRPRAMWVPRSMAVRVLAGACLFSAAATGAWSAIGVVMQAREDSHRASATVPPLRAHAQSPTTTRRESMPTSASVVPPPSNASTTRVTIATEPSHGERVVGQFPRAGTSKVPPDATSALAAPAGVTPDETATSLFATANLARRDRQSERAIALYRRLQLLFPESIEARDCSLILGKLELETSPASALSQFRRYGEGDSTELTADALWGQSRALSKLGRTGEERAVLERLLSSFPSTPYSGAARHRLDALSTESH